MNERRETQSRPQKTRKERTKPPPPTTPKSVRSSFFFMRCYPLLLQPIHPSTHPPTLSLLDAEIVVAHRQRRRQNAQYQEGLGACL